MFRRMQINTQERAVSTDFNRLQAFARRGIAEVFRRTLIDQTSEDDLGLYVEPTTLTAPLTAEILRGLLVRPQQATLNLLVDPGVLFALAPDGAADESSCRPVEDAGVTIVGSLVMTANASGSTRIDVIECRINGTPTTVSDNRDIYNASTGLFAATSVTKEIAMRLEYRVRAGTPNAGMPAHAEGWLPLCIASVPNGATTVDTMTFWDVRPLAEDRERPMLTLDGLPPSPELNAQVRYDATGAIATLVGHSLAVHEGRRVGGLLRRGSPGTDADGVDLTDAANQEPTFALAGTEFFYVYLLTPHGLPRWARYTDGPAARTPRPTKGILVVSKVAPTGIGGAPSSAITLPTSTGLVTSTTSGVCLFAASSALGLPRKSVFERRRAYNVTAPSDPVRTAFVIGPSAYERWTFEPGTTHPKNARRILIAISSTYDVTSTSSMSPAATIEVMPTPYNGSGSLTDNPSYQLTAEGTSGAILTNATGGTLPRTVTYRFWIPVPTNYPGAVANFDVYRSVPASLNGTPTVSVIGWEL